MQLKAEAACFIGLVSLGIARSETGDCAVYCAVMDNTHSAIHVSKAIRMRSFPTRRARAAQHIKQFALENAGIITLGKLYLGSGTDETR